MSSPSRSIDISAEDFLGTCVPLFCSDVALHNGRSRPQASQTHDADPGFQEGTPQQRPVWSRLSGSVMSYQPRNSKHWDKPHRAFGQLLAECLHFPSTAAFSAVVYRRPRRYDGTFISLAAPLVICALGRTADVFAGDVTRSARS